MSRPRKNRMLLDNIGCCVEAVHCDIVGHKGTLFMRHGHCCDMTACINLFKAIDPAVVLIETFSGLGLDTVYERRGEDDWHARNTRWERNFTQKK